MTHMAMDITALERPGVDFPDTISIGTFTGIRSSHTAPESDYGTYLFAVSGGPDVILTIQKKKKGDSYGNVLTSDYSQPGGSTYVGLKEIAGRLQAIESARCTGAAVGSTSSTEQAASAIEAAKVTLEALAARTSYDTDNHLRLLGTLGLLQAGNDLRGNVSESAAMSLRLLWQRSGWFEHRIVSACLVTLARNTSYEVAALFSEDLRNPYTSEPHDAWLVGGKSIVHAKLLGCTQDACELLRQIGPSARCCITQLAQVACGYDDKTGQVALTALSAVDVDGSNTRSALERLFADGERDLREAGLITAGDDGIKVMAQQLQMDSPPPARYAAKAHALLSVSLIAPPENMSSQLEELSTPTTDAGLEQRLGELWKEGNMKPYAQAVVIELFGTDLQRHPDIWEALYDIFKDARAQGLDMGALIKVHLIDRNEIVNMIVMDLLIRAHAELERLQSAVSA